MQSRKALHSFRSLHFALIEKEESRLEIEEKERRFVYFFDGKMRNIRYFPPLIHETEQST